MTDEPKDLVPITAAVTPGLPPGLTVEKILELIDALARNLYDDDYVVKQFGFTAEQFKLLSANEWFQKYLDQQRADWNKASNVNTRLAIQASLILEKNMPMLSKRLGNPAENPTAVVALAKLLSEMAGTSGPAKAAPQENKERFKIVFNLGADIQQFDKSKVMIDVTPDTTNG